MSKNTLITGASSGLGAGMAKELAAKGNNLALCARRTDRLEALKEELLAINPNITVLVKALDVTQFDDVFSVTEAFDAEFKAATGRGLERYIANAGVGAEGETVGKGKFEQNKRIIDINFTAVLAQAEAAMGLFRERGKGHLVIVSSMSAMRGQRGMLATYAATKAAVAHLAEGLRADCMRKPGIKVTTLYPGYIKTELTGDNDKLPFIIEADKGCKLLVKEIEAEVDEACVPAWPWKPVGFLMRNLPLKQVAKLN
jgi:short-subunit dehydrogenase